MSNLQNINLKDLFDSSRINEFNRSLQNINRNLSNTDKTIKSVSTSFINSISGLDSAVSLFNNIIKTTSSGLSSLITGFSLLNKNLGNAVKLFSLINETPGISSRSSAQILSEESGNAGGFNGTGNPDPKDIDPELLRLNDLYTRLTTLMDIELDKGIISVSTKIPASLDPKTALAWQGVDYLAQEIANIFEKIVSSNDGKRMDTELVQAGVPKDKVKQINWDNFSSINSWKEIYGLLFQYGANKNSGLGNFSNGYDLGNFILSLKDSFINRSDLSEIRDNIYEKILKRRAVIDEDIKNRPGTVETGNPYPTPTTREAFYKLNQDILFPRYFSPSFPLKPYGPEKPESEKVASGQKGSEESSLSNFALSANNRAGKSKKGSSKKEEDPVDTFVGVFSEVQKVGGALTTIMQTLNIGADTFVGGIINGFNSALSIIQTMITVMQAVNTIKMFLPFATGGSVPGIGDTDSVPAMLTPGEYVVKKSVVNKFGSGFFEWINGGGLTNSTKKNEEYYFVLAA